MIVFALLHVPEASAETTLTYGISGSESLLPYAALHDDRTWKSEGWNFSAKFDGRVQLDAGVADATAAIESHADTKLSQKTFLEFDAHYTYEREFNKAIKQSHNGGVDFGLEHEFEAFTLKTDIGLAGRIHEDTTQVGFPALDRQREDFRAAELSSRITGNQIFQANPFVEMAFVQRGYFVNTGRDFSGPEMIVGVTLSNLDLTGDLAVKITRRRKTSREFTFAIGPQIDVEWAMQNNFGIAFAVGTELDQDTSGSDDVYKTYSGRVEAKYKFNSEVNFIAALDALYENRDLMNETEIAPQLKLDWQQENGFGGFISTKWTYSKVQHEPGKWGPHVDVGLKWQW